MISYLVSRLEQHDCERKWKPCVTGQEEGRVYIHIAANLGFRIFFSFCDFFLPLLFFIFVTYAYFS
jgi:hypothetical protein